MLYDIGFIYLPTYYLFVYFLKTIFLILRTNPSSTMLFSFFYMYWQSTHLSFFQSLHRL